METLLANVSGKVRRVFRDGKEWYVAPLSLIVPGVLNGSKGALLYPPEEISDNPSKWNDIPLTLYHPFDALGNPVSANHPGVAEKQYLGWVKNASANGKLRADGWFSVEKLQRLAPHVLNALDRGQPIELSTGLYTDNEPATGQDGKGRAYEFIARNYRADHVAVLPDQQGACSIKDGCGVLVNHGKHPLTINPSWVEDEDVWEKAKAQADKTDTDDYYAVVTAIYKKMGGGIKGNTRNRGYDPTEERPLDKDSYPEKCQHCGSPTGVNPSTGKCIDCGKQNEPTHNSNPEGCNQYKDCEAGGGDVHPVAKKHLDAIMSRPHPPSNADQAEQQGRNEYFNRSELSKTFKNHKEAGKAIRKAYEARGTHNRKSLLNKLTSLLGFNKDAEAPRDVDPRAPAQPLGRGNWSLMKRSNRAKELTESAEGASGAALENPSGHQEALDVHKDAAYAHIAAYEEARMPSSTKGESDYSLAGYHKNQADYHLAKVKYHGAQAKMHKDKIKRGEAVAVNKGDYEDGDVQWKIHDNASKAQKFPKEHPTSKAHKYTGDPSQHKVSEDSRTPGGGKTAKPPGPGRHPIEPEEPEAEDPSLDDEKTENDAAGYSGSINCDMGPRPNMLYNDAGDASTGAGQASMQTGHEAGMSHSIAAIGAAKGKDGKQAAKSHVAAAKAHEDEALRLRRDGYHDRAHEHDTAAAAHRKAASMHSATHNSEGETVNREAILNRLGQKGCFCQESLQVLNQLTDRELVVLNAKMTKDIGPDLDFMEGEEEDDEGLEGQDLHSFDGKPRKTKAKQAGGAGTPDEYNTNTSMKLNQLPREFREDILFAREMKNRMRNDLLDRLTANASSDDDRKRSRSIYAKMGLQDLRDLADGLPAPTENNPLSGAHTLPLYFGAAAPTGNAIASGPREVTETTQTLNYDELAAPGLLAHLGRKARTA